MFIETEQTPNPSTLKFLPGRDVLASGSAEFANEAEAAVSPLAAALLSVDGIARVFLGRDFISVTKQSENDWTELKPLVLGAIVEHFTQGRPVMLETGPDAAMASVREEDRAIVDQIQELLEQRVRPAVAMDGGDIVFHGYRDGVVHLQMKGACGGCPSSRATLKNGVENLLRHFIPEVRSVEQVEA